MGAPQSPHRGACSIARDQALLVEPFRRRCAVRSPDPLVYLLAMDSDLSRGVDANSHLIAPHAQHNDRDVITNMDLFTRPSSQYEHAKSFSLRPPRQSILRKS